GGGPGRVPRADAGRPGGGPGGRSAGPAQAAPTHATRREHSWGPGPARLRPIGGRGRARFYLRVTELSWTVDVRPSLSQVIVAVPAFASIAFTLPISPFDFLRT